MPTLFDANQSLTRARSTRSAPDEPGVYTDTVRIQLGSDELRICESYEVERGIFTQPTSFAVALGDDSSAAGLWKRYPPRTPFKLWVDDRLIQSGFTDSRTISGVGAGFMLRGRDILQDVHDSYTQEEKVYKAGKHSDFIFQVFQDANVPLPSLQFSNEAVRKAMALGKPLGFPATAREEVTIPRPVQIKMGDTYYSFIKRVLDRAGLFLFATPQQDYVLSAPDKDQPAIYKVVHCPNKGRQVGDVINVSLSDSTVGRSAYYMVYARGGGKNKGRLVYQDGYPDEEMAAFGYKRTKTFRDWHIQNNAQAETLARRRIAEERRSSWRLTMTVSGHSTLALDGSRGVWTPDTMVHVKSDELEIDGPFYLESVAFRRNSDGTTSELRLIRPDDLIFGYEDA